MEREMIPLISPGEILKEEYLEPNNISQTRLASDLDIPASRVNEIIKGTRAITVDTAIRLAKYFGTSAQYWINLQTNFEIEQITRSGEYDYITSRIREKAGEFVKSKIA